MSALARFRFNFKIILVLIFTLCSQTTGWKFQSMVIVDKLFGDMWYWITDTLPYVYKPFTIVWWENVRRVESRKC